MPRRIRRCILAALVAMPSLPAALGAQNAADQNVERAKHAAFAPLVERLGTSARALALGGAGVALRDPEALLSNPALLAFRVEGIGADYERLGERATLRSASAASTLGESLGVGASVRLLDWSAASGPYRVAERGLARGGPDPASSLAASVGGATIVRGLRVGVALKYLEERIALDRGASSALDLGVARTYGYYTLGAALQDLGPTMRVHRDAGTEEISLPTRVTVGAAGGGLPVGPFDLGATAALSLRHDGRVSPAAGLEAEWIPVEGIGAVARIGARRPDLADQGVLTAGGSLLFDRIALDVAWESFDVGKSGVRIGVRIRDLAR